MNKLLIVMVLLLSACSATIPPAPIVKDIQVDLRLLESCKPLLSMSSDKPSWEGFQQLTGDNALIYADCKKKQEASITFIKGLK